MLLLNKKDIARVFSMEDAIASVKEAFAMASEKSCHIPLRTNIQVPKYDACYLVMPAYAEKLDTAAIKMIGCFPQNVKEGLPSLPAQIFLADGTTGMVSAALDGTYITQLRTGAASGAAFDILAKKNCRIGALIGTGGQAAAQLEAMITVRDLNEVRIYSRHADHAAAFADEMRKKLAHCKADIICAASSAEAVDNADMIITATPSKAPVFDGSLVKKGATISCIGSYQPFMQELPPDLLVNADKVYFDSRDAVLAEAGDMIIPLEQGIITEERFTGELGEVISGRITGREDDAEIIIFKSVGIAAQDLCTAKAIYDKAVISGIGFDWN